jgi:hypothetical protein
MSCLLLAWLLTILPQHQTEADKSNGNSGGVRQDVVAKRMCEDPIGILQDKLTYPESKVIGKPRTSPNVYTARYVSDHDYAIVAKWYKNAVYNTDKVLEIIQHTVNTFSILVDDSTREGNKPREVHIQSYLFHDLATDCIVSITISHADKERQTHILLTILQNAKPR